MLSGNSVNAINPSANMSRPAHEPDIGRKRISKGKIKEGPTELDIAMEKVIRQMAASKEHQKILDNELRKVERIDKKIEWYKDKIAELEDQKQKELSRFGELLDLAMKSTHMLKNGYFIKPDDRRKVEVKDVPKFLKWLKENKEPQVVLEFFNDALKITNLKAFVDREANHQRVNGVVNPSVDGVDIGEITYRRFKTGYKKRR